MQSSRILVLTQSRIQACKQPGERAMCCVFSGYWIVDIGTDDIISNVSLLHQKEALVSNGDIRLYAQEGGLG